MRTRLHTDQQKNLWSCAGYMASKKLTLGGTIVRLGEDILVKQSYGDDPVGHTMYGLDLDYRSNWPRLTKWLDKLPWYSTRKSSIMPMQKQLAGSGSPPTDRKGNEGRYI